MLRPFFPKTLLLLPISIAAVLFIITNASSNQTVSGQTGETQGALRVVDAEGKAKALCPLKHTSVKAQISGFLSRVVVTQEFQNPFQEKIEAVYTFPLPQNAAVDDMTMVVGERTVRGKILRREEAQAVYEAAKSGGQVASLLDQERPNIFTQSVANILPGEQVKVTISYVETLKYEDGSYEFVFPMVVGPRYIPQSPKSGGDADSAADNNPVPDAGRITPPLVPEGMRVGYDISLEVSLDAGLSLASLDSKTHAVEVERSIPSQAFIKLKNNSVIPNKDFILRYDVAGKGIDDALLTHRTQKGGFFTLILQPPDRVSAEDVSPKELVFVLDTSGSMGGFPIEKAKETMRLAIDNLYPADTFNLITFSGDTRILFPEPVPATPENLKKAQAFLAQSASSGGTEMMKAIKAALEPSDSQKHVRIVCFMTDGYVGNDLQILSEIKNHPNARVFAFGIGNSVNRFLLDNMADIGRGEVEYVGLKDEGSVAARRFHERVRSPLLTDISIEWNGLPVADIYPEKLPDLFSVKPVIVSGRFTAAGQGVARLRGKMAGREFAREIAVSFPESRAAHEVLATLWARNRIGQLLSQDYGGAQQGNMQHDLKETITQLGLEYRLMTQFTSFVAVEEMIVTEGGQPRRVDVPIEVPEGVNRDSLVGDPNSPMKIGGFVNFSAVQSLAVTESGRNAIATTVIRPGVTGGTVAGAGGGTGSRSRRSQAKSGKQVPSPPNAPPAVVLSADESIRVLSPEEQRRNEQLKKFHPTLVMLIDRLKKPDAKPNPDESRFVREGKAEIQVWLTEKTPETLAQLKEAGFEILLDPKTSKLVIGRLPLAKLEQLAALKFVRYVVPSF